MTPIGRRVLCLRHSAQLTRRELAVKMGIKLEDTITRIELGETKPQPWTLLKIALAFGMTFSELIAGTDFETNITDLRTLPNQTVVAYRDADSKLRVLFYGDADLEPYEGGFCSRFRCYAGRGHYHCCADCSERATCAEACQNDPTKCGLYQTR